MTKCSTFDHIFVVGSHGTQAKLFQTSSFFRTILGLFCVFNFLNFVLLLFMWFTAVTASLSMFSICSAAITLFITLSASSSLNYSLQRIHQWIVVVSNQHSLLCHQIHLYQNLLLSCSLLSLSLDTPSTLLLDLLLFLYHLCLLFEFVYFYLCLLYGWNIYILNLWWVFLIPIQKLISHHVISAFNVV